MSDFKIVYIVIVTTQHGTSIKNAHVDQQDRIKDPEINPYICSDLILTKSGKAIH
jgi:hypothetical protein